MSKFSGKIGFAQTTETSIGVWKDVVVERFYKGDMTKSSYRYSDKDRTNSNITLNNSISIVADSYAISNIGNLKYAVVYGTPWEITDVDIKYPRLILQLGGVYNGETL